MPYPLFWGLLIAGVAITLFIGFLLRKKKFGLIFIPPIIIIISATFVTTGIDYSSIEEHPYLHSLPILIYSIGAISLIVSWIRFYKDTKKYYQI